MKRNVTELRPTQFALGMKEVEVKVGKIQGLKEKELDRYLEDHPVPFVLGPGQELYIIDHHHLVRASWEAGLGKVHLEQKKDLSQLEPKEFWKQMIQNHWAYLFDQFGNGPHEPDHLPADVRCMADDPFRSLAWLLRESGGFEKCPIPFSEFKWAEFLRKHVKIEHDDHGFKKALKDALTLASSPHCAHLPGHKKN